MKAVLACLCALLCVALAHNISAVVNLPVPMIHQRWDVPSYYDGSWGCGPTSTVMALAYYKRVPPKPISCPLPKPHQNSFGWYLPTNYTLYGTVFDHMDKDPKGTPVYGAFGWCTKNGAAWAALCNDFAQRHHVKTNFVSSGSSWSKVKAALDRGHPVVLDTRLTSAGHIILVRGYDAAGNMIVNDPYGNAHDRTTYGKLTNGEGVRYTFDFTKSAGRWFIEVIG